MKTDLAQILDICIGRVMSGESIDAVLADYPEVRDQLEPLLSAALTVSSTPKVGLTAEYIESSRERLMTRIWQEQLQHRDNRKADGPHLLDGISRFFGDTWHSFVAARKIAIPVVVVLALLLTAGLNQFVFSRPTPAYASTSTLSILSGNVSIRYPGSSKDVAGKDGMILGVGTMIKTDADSNALLTFNDGSTIRLDPKTSLQVLSSSYENGIPKTILKQWLGRTWSRVVKMVDPGSRFEIQTPTATAIVRGTLFTTQVDDTGATTVSTTEGLVSVSGQSNEVFVAPDQQTEVTTGSQPSAPAPSPTPKSEIILTVNGTAVGAITDPTGASTGLLPDGSYFNQIPGSRVISGNGTQSLRIPDLVSGKYSIVLRYDNLADNNYTIQYLNNGNVVLQNNGTLEPVQGKQLLIDVSVKTENGNFVSAAVNSIAPLKNNGPQKFVDTSANSGNNKGKNNNNGPDVNNKGSNENSNSQSGQEKNNSSNSEVNYGQSNAPDVNRGQDNSQGNAPDVNRGQDNSQGNAPNVNRGQDNGPGRANSDIEHSQDNNGTTDVNPGQGNAPDVTPGQGNAPDVTPGQGNTNGQGNNSNGNSGPNNGNSGQGNTNGNADVTNGNSGQGNSDVTNGNSGQGNTNGNADVTNGNSGQGNTNGNADVTNGNSGQGNTNGNADVTNGNTGQSNSDADQGTSPGKGKNNKDNSDSDKGKGNKDKGSASAKTGKNKNGSSLSTDNSTTGSGKGNNNIFQLGYIPGL